MKHKHADLIHAWADGARIEYLDKQNGVWEETTSPWWDEAAVYRIKPKAPAYFEETARLYWDRHFNMFCGAGEPNIKFTFDAETGKLVSAQVLP
jgi:hypothetical protein